MLIRSATLADLNACLELGADSQTDYVWQMDNRRENHTVTIRFQTVRLPRTMYVRYPCSRDDLLACWERGSTVLVVTNKPKTAESATEMEEETDAGKQAAAPIFGYCQLDAEPWHKTAWITHLIVDRPYRRRGIGTALLKASIAWGKSRGLERLMIAVQTKNYPAIAFCEKNNLIFCGFNDHYYVNRDIALFFTLRIGGSSDRSDYPVYVGADTNGSQIGTDF